METLTQHRMPERVSSHRRANKPLVEKRRRARINDSLSQLKSLLLQAMKQDSAQFSRLEKADILEMTVKYLRHMQKQHVTASMSNDPGVAQKYRAGFNECANEVLKYMHTAGAVKDQVKCSLGDHLAKCLTVVNHDTSPYQDRQHTSYPETQQTPYQETQRTPYSETEQTPYPETLQTPYPETLQTPYSETQQTYPVRACSVSPIRTQDDMCLPPLEIQIPENSDSVMSSPCKQTTSTNSLLLMPLAQSTPVVPVILVHDDSASISPMETSPDGDMVANNFNSFKNITNIREYVQQTTSYPHCPVYPVARMPNRMFESVSPVLPYSPPQCVFKEEKVWRPW